MSATMPQPAFSSDDGAADPRVSAALAAFDGGTGGSGDVVSALAASRLLVPVVSVLDENDDVLDEDDDVLDDNDERDDTGAEKSSYMATVSMTSRSGRRGLLAFTCLDAMKAWDPQARPVPVSTRAAAEAALADSAAAVVVDIAGPVTFPIEAEDLRSLAAGWRSHADSGVRPAGSSAGPGEGSPGGWRQAVGTFTRRRRRR